MPSLGLGIPTRGSFARISVARTVLVRGSVDPGSEEGTAPGARLAVVAPGGAREASSAEVVQPGGGVASELGLLEGLALPPSPKGRLEIRVAAQPDATNARLKATTARSGTRFMAWLR